VYVVASGISRSCDKRNYDEYRLASKFVLLEVSRSLNWDSQCGVYVLIRLVYDKGF